MGKGDGAKVPESAGEGWLYGEQPAETGKAEDDEDVEATEAGMWSGDVMVDMVEDPAPPQCSPTPAPVPAAPPDKAAPEEAEEYPLCGVIGDMTPHPESAGDGVGW